MAAPVCHIPTETPITQPAGNRVAAVPVATDLKSALLALSAIRKILQDVLDKPGPGNGAHEPSQPPRPKPKPGRWVESKRSTEIVKLPIGDDPANFVEIERMNSLTMKDSITGEDWTWSRSRTR